MSIPKQCDVVVVGGGPAGSLAATYLSQKGYEVVLFEKQRHPRYNVGESLIPDFWKYCEMAGATEAIKAEGFIVKAGGMVAWKGQTRTHNFKDFGYANPALHVERDRFDYILLQNARARGAQVFEDVAVLDADLGNGARPSVHYRSSAEQQPGEISCRFVVDASGQSAVVGKQLGVRVIDDGFRYMSVWGYFQNGRYVDYDGKVHPPQDVMVASPTTYITSLDETGDSGWAWYIILRDSVSMGLVLSLEVMKTLKVTEEGGWENYFLRKCREIPVVNRLLENARYCEGSLRVIRDYSYQSTRLAGPGFFLIGDAAGFIDPIFSVGVVLGMYSAFAAAWAIDRSLADGKSAEQNQALFTRQLHGRLEIARSLALPRYKSSGSVSDLAKVALQLERTAVKDLMHVVSTLTTRSDNFLEMADADGKHGAKAEKFRTIEEIIF